MYKYTAIKQFKLNQPEESLEDFPLLCYTVHCGILGG